MSGREAIIADVPVYVRESGAPLASEHDAVDLMSEASGGQPEWYVVPVEQFAPDFFTLRTRMAGLFIQKLVNYGRRLAVVGDLSEHTAKSTALRDFVAESNRGRHVWFVADIAEFQARLAGGASG